MIKLIAILFISLIFCSCNNKELNSSTSIQNEFQNKKIEEATKKLNEKVLETGSSPAGIRFIEISKQVTSRTRELINRVDNDEKITSLDIEELIKLVNYKKDTIRIDTTFIIKAFEEYRATGTDDFTTSLLLFNFSVIENTRDLFANFFYNVEYFKPIVISEKFTIKKGETFNGTAILQAKMVGIKYIYKIEDPQTDEGFVKVPSWASSDYDGIVQIKGITPGTHKVKLRTTQIANGEERAFEGEFDLTVTR